MNTKRLILSAIAALVLATPAFAACEQVVTTVKPDNAPVYGTKTSTAGSAGSSKGSSYDIATFCPRVHAEGTCGGVTLSEKVQGNAEYNALLGNYGYVADIMGAQFYTILFGNRVNIGNPVPNLACP